MIFNNFGQALRASVGPYVLLIAVSALIGAVAFSGNTNLPAVLSGVVPPEALTGNFLQLFAGLFAIIVVVIFVSAWVAVSWHRFILLEEYSGILPALSGRPIWSYVGRTLLCILVITVLAACGLLLLSLVPGVVLGVIFALILMAFLSVVWFRIGVSLPAVAVGKPVGMGDAWRATGKLADTIIKVVLLLFVIGMIAGAATTGLYNINVYLGYAVDIFVQWVTLMVGISILTTLYGHVIEGRPLID